ncbi:MAG TPA: hypothetical protein VIG99_01795 [Myxococcaceae bacterium]|jgi:hypothetical protein
MGRILRSLLAAGIGVFLGWIALPACLVLSAVALGGIEAAGHAPSGAHVLALWAAVFVLLGLAGGVAERIAHGLRERRSVEKPVPPPWISRWAFRQLALAVAVLGVCWMVRSTGLAEQGWFQDLATIAAWLAIWSGAVACVALTLAAGTALRGSQAHGRRIPSVLALAGCLSVLALPQVRSLAGAELEPYDELVAAARRDSESSSTASASTSAAAFAAMATARPGEGCAESFLRPEGTRRSAWTMNERIARRRARYGVDVEQILLDAVDDTCRRKPAKPAHYFTKVVKHAINRGGRPPDGDDCDLDPELPGEPADPTLPIQSRRCLMLLQQRACDDGDTMVAILYLVASGATYPEVGRALEMGESAVKTRMWRFMNDLPAPIREQCR